MPMIIKFRKKVFLYLLFFAIVLLLGVLCIKFCPGESSFFAGGSFGTQKFPDIPIGAIHNSDTEIYDRFRRPSWLRPLDNPYSFSDFQKDNDEKPLITKKFDSPLDVSLAYFGILNKASNLEGYSGGCGSVGDGLNPYPYAYELFTASKQSEITLKDFIASFKGIGYITLLELTPSYDPAKTENTETFMFEIETIEGDKVKVRDEECKDCEHNHFVGFSYYYGVIKAEKTDAGYKISCITMIPEDFLCAPEHSWFYLGDAVVEIVYKDNLGIIEKIDKMEQDGNRIYIYASGHGKNYRFDFIRVTNGYDILLFENINESGVWKPVDLGTQEWNMKLQGC